tara:strand:- start:135 stop:884 length:750 start_codon:yes stop_codon:yes gene_type:complete
LIKSKKFKKFKNIKHSFFNNLGGVSSGIYKSLNCGVGSNDSKTNVIKNLKIVSKKIVKNKKIVLLNQLHSSKIYFINKFSNRKLMGDGLITSTRGIPIGILTADCAPILFFDPRKNIIGAAHSGWKGAYKKIGKKMVNIFKKRGSRLNDIYAVIGPCISQNNYEIKNDFKTKFLRQSIKNKKYFKISKKKIYFDLKGYIFRQLKNAGINNIEIIKKDTFNPKNNFFSARRSLKNKINDYGRNISIIMIK